MEGNYGVKVATPCLLSFVCSTFNVRKKGCCFGCRTKLTHPWDIGVLTAAVVCVRIEAG